MKVCIFRATDGACDLYRAVSPVSAGREHGDFQMEQIWMQNILFDMFHREKDFRKALASDIFLLQRHTSLTFMDKIKRIMEENRLRSKVVIDHDDDIFTVSPLSNHYVDHGTEEVKVIHNGAVIHEWKDGVNFDMKKNRENMDEAKRCIERADLITVTTEHLAEVFRQYTDRIRVLPNCVNLKAWNRLDIRRNNPDEIRIAWAGGHSHWEDLFMVKQPLIEIAKKYPNVKIVMIGWMPSGMDKDFSPGQLEYHDWVETPAHPYRMAALDIDIAVIPLKDTIFNRSKSSIKWVEFSALSIPSVISNITPYAEMRELSEKSNGLYVADNDPQGWIKAMSMLIEDKALRRDVGDAARESVVQHFDINSRFHEWVTAYEEVLAWQPHLIRP